MSIRMPDNAPSEKQHEVWEYVVGHICTHGFQPTYAEMAAHFGVTEGAIMNRMRDLEKRGLVEMTGRERSIVLKHVKFQAVYEPKPEGV